MTVKLSGIVLNHKSYVLVNHETENFLPLPKISNPKSSFGMNEAQCREHEMNLEAQLCTLCERNLVKQSASSDLHYCVLGVHLDAYFVGDFSDCPVDRSPCCSHQPGI